MENVKKKEKNYESPSVEAIVSGTFELMSSSGSKSITVDADFTNGTDVNASGGTNDENHTGTTDGGNNIFGY
jgi:hypothetical protein